MGGLWVLALALALAMDAFAVSVGVSVNQKGLSRNQVLRLAAGFGVFQWGMPLLGWLAGQAVSKAIRSLDHWVAFVLLALVGLKMIYESFKPEMRENKSKGDPTTGTMLLLLSIATSIDALAAGLGFAALNRPVFVPALVIGIVAFVAAVVGAKIGPLFGRLVGRWAELAGGCVLIAIGIKILIDHL